MSKSATSTPSLSDRAALATKPTPNPRTFLGRVRENKLTVRRLCGSFHVAAETLKAALTEPGRLTINHVMAFSKMVGETPEKVAADLFAEVGELRKKGPAETTAKRGRTLKAKVPKGD